MATPAIAPQVPNVAASRGRSPSIQELTDSDSENIPPTTQDTGDAVPSAPSSPAEAPTASWACHCFCVHSGSRHPLPAQCTRC